MFRRVAFGAIRPSTRSRTNRSSLHAQQLRHNTTKPTTTPETRRQKTIRYLFNPFAAPPILAGYEAVSPLARYMTFMIVASLTLHTFWEYGYSVSETYGISMLPNFASSGDWVVISKYYRRGREVSVGDTVSFKIPTRPGERGLKRVLGMPGDFVLRDTPMTTNMMMQIPTGHCWVVGDNLTWSHDSRMYGPIPLALITGKVVGRWRWPMDVQRVQDGLRPAVEHDDDE